MTLTCAMIPSMITLPLQECLGLAATSPYQPGVIGSCKAMMAEIGRGETGGLITRGRPRIDCVTNRLYRVPGFPVMGSRVVSLMALT